MGSIWGFLTKTIITSIIAKALIGIGFSFLVVKGLTELLQLIFGEIQVLMSGFPDIILNLLGLTGFDLALNMIFAAYTCSITISQLKKMQL